MLGMTETFFVLMVQKGIPRILFTSSLKMHHKSRPHAPFHTVHHSYSYYTRLAQIMQVDGFHYSFTFIQLTKEQYICISVPNFISIHGTFILMTQHSRPPKNDLLKILKSIANEIYICSAAGEYILQKLREERDFSKIVLKYEIK